MLRKVNNKGNDMHTKLKELTVRIFNNVDETIDPASFVASIELPACCVTKIC
jgi:hypothetical protein